MVAHRNRFRFFTMHAPEEWGLDWHGNKRLSNLAEHAADCLGQRGVENHWFVMGVLKEFLVGWMRMGNTKSYADARHPEVRENVKAFHDRLAKMAGVDPYDSWCENYTKARHECGTARTKHLYPLW